MTVDKFSISKAINLGLEKILKDYSQSIILGEDIGNLGGVFRVTEGLKKKFGKSRVIDTPLGESGIIGTAIGLAFNGFLPICEIQFDGFVFPGFNQITTQLAKIYFRSEGRINMPIVIRIPYGGGIGAVEHHSESPEALFAHTAGLRIIFPSNANDAYWSIIQSAILKDPVIIFEPKKYYWLESEIDFCANDKDIFLSKYITKGQDITLVTYGSMIPLALSAYVYMKSKKNINIEIIDLRSISPIDFSCLIPSVKKTGKMMILHEAPIFGGIGGEIAARTLEKLFFYLKAPILRVGAFHMPYPMSKIEKYYLPDLNQVLYTIYKLLSY